MTYVDNASIVPQPNITTGPGEKEILYMALRNREIKSCRITEDNKDSLQDAALMVLRRDKPAVNIAHANAMISFAIREANRNAQRNHHNHNYSIDEMIHTKWEPISSSDVYADAEKTELRQAIGIAIARLHPLSQRIIEMRYYEDLSLAEVAKALRIKTGRAYKYEQQALLTLRRLLADFAPVGTGIESRNFGPLFSRQVR